MCVCVHAGVCVCVCVWQRMIQKEDKCVQLLVGMQQLVWSVGVINQEEAAAHPG